VKFLIDANLPYKLTHLLLGMGYDVIHTDHLPDKERTKDEEIRNISLREGRVVITKDSDFLESHLIREIPLKLIWINTGNIVNHDLFHLIDKYFAYIVSLLDQVDLVEMTNTDILIHEK
jgi:predicted nuclease of predicted toxin-antitoxin system